ncbi:MAG: hypothetical protein ACYTKD_05155 [Planctomycetota bacterium]
MPPAQPTPRLLVQEPLRDPAASMVRMILGLRPGDKMRETESGFE